MTTATHDPAVLDLIAEQQELEAAIMRNECSHTPLGALKDVCRQCWRHHRADEIDRAIVRLSDG